MGSNLKIQQGSNGGWFIYKDGVLLLGSRDKDLLEKVKMFLENEADYFKTKLKKTKLCSKY